MTEDTRPPARDISDGRPEAADAADAESAASPDAPAALADMPDARADAPTPRRALIVARAGRHRLAVFAEEAEGVSKFVGPAPLPFAPPAVLGVVSVRGRMRTLIDPLALLRPDAASPSSPAPPHEETPPALAILLKGDEQLALAVSVVERPVEIRADSISPPEPAHDFARGAVTLDDAPVLILDPTRLFEAAMRGHERRRGR